MANYVWPLPLNSPITQYFGTNPYSPVQPQGHTGMDFGVSVGTQVVAIADGTVIFADWATKLSPNNPWYIAPGYAGIVLLIDHGHVISVSAHLSETHLNAGDRVTQGQGVAKTGNTGLSTGPHLHFEIMPKPVPASVDWLAGRANPLNYISKVTAQGGGGAAPAASLKSNERLVGPSNVNQRSEPSTSAGVVRVITANTIETFSGYVIGESVTVAGQAGVRAAVSSDIWYKDSQGYVWAGGFTEQKTDGLSNLTPAAPALTPNQRRVGGSNVNQRSEANTSAKVVRVIPANTVETFSGYVIGEQVTVAGEAGVRAAVSSNIWYRDGLGYVWSGGFTEQSTKGLDDQTPAPPALADNQRRVGGSAVNQRSEPNTSAPVIRTIDANTIETFTGYVEGENHVVPGEAGVRAAFASNIWYKDSQGYVWAGGFTSQSVHGLQKQDAPADTPEEPPYEFIPDFDFVEYKPANTWNMQNGNFPSKPAKIVIHQFDAKDKKPSLDGVIDWFQTRRPKPSSAHFAVSGKRIVQLVSLSDRAQHAGPVGNDYIGIEVDPQEDADTVESVKKLIRAINKKYGVTYTYIEHRDVPENNTSCGEDIHLEKYALVDLDKPEEHPKHPAPAPAPKPAPEVPGKSAEPETTLEMEAKIIAKFLSNTSTKMLKDYLDSQK